MDVYVYQAALWCEECAEKIQEDLLKEGKTPTDRDDESSYDSDDYPKGPYPDGGGESDSPQHCDGCHCFLENDLTEEGRRCLHEMIVDRFARPRNKVVRTQEGSNTIITRVKLENEEDPMREWIDFYDVSVEDLLDWSES